VFVRIGSLFNGVRVRVCGIDTSNDKDNGDNRDDNGDNRDEPE
jgi:hypothetical protein